MPAMQGVLWLSTLAVVLGGGNDKDPIYDDNCVCVQDCEYCPLPAVLDSMAGDACKLPPGVPAPPAPPQSPGGCCPTFMAKIKEFKDDQIKLVVRVHPWVAGRMVKVQLPGFRIGDEHVRLDLNDVTYIGKSRRLGDHDTVTIDGTTDLDSGIQLMCAAALFACPSEQLSASGPSQARRLQ